jgi:hypothetical protein
MLALYTALAVLAGDLTARARERLNADRGFTTMEWVIIGSIAFAMAIAVGAGLKAVAENYMAKIN